MNDSSCGRKRVAGYNQFIKLVRRGKAVRVWLASDADFAFAENIRRELLPHSHIILDESQNSKQLAKSAGVDVPTAVITEAAE